MLQLLRWVGAQTATARNRVVNGASVAARAERQPYGCASHSKDEAVTA